MRIVTVVALIAAGMLGVFLTRETQRAAELEVELAKMKESARALEGHAARLQGERDSLRQAQGLQPIQPVRPPMETRAAPGMAKTEASGGNESARLLEERAEQLAEARKIRGELEAQIRQLESRIQSLTQDTERLAASEKQLREQTEAATRRAAALEDERKGRDERLLKAELSIRELRLQAEDSGKRSARLARISEDFEDLDRRRDSYMTNVLRRYREVTDLYRTLSLRQEGPRDDLSRIQSAISLAEEDMRQLQSLNAQARRLQKDLANLPRP